MCRSPKSYATVSLNPTPDRNVGALMIGIGLSGKGGVPYYNCRIVYPPNPILIIKAAILPAKEFEVSILELIVPPGSGSGLNKAA